MTLQPSFLFFQTYKPLCLYSTNNCGSLNVGKGTFSFHILVFYSSLVVSFIRAFYTTSEGIVHLLKNSFERVYYMTPATILHGKSLINLLHCNCLHFIYDLFVSLKIYMYQNIDSLNRITQSHGLRRSYVLSSSSRIITRSHLAPKGLLFLHN